MYIFLYELQNQHKEYNTFPYMSIRYWQCPDYFHKQEIFNI